MFFFYLSDIFGKDFGISDSHDEKIGWFICESLGEIKVSVWMKERIIFFSLSNIFSNEFDISESHGEETGGFICVSSKESKVSV